MSSFLSYAKRKDPKIGNMLAKYAPGSKAFDSAWKGIAAMKPAEFNRLQHNFIKASHFDPAAKMIKGATGFDVNRYSVAVQNVLWSTAVQHGSGGAKNIFRNAGIRPGMSEAEIIRRVYNERGANNGLKYFSRSSASIRQSVVNRFRNEMNDALRMLG